MKKLCLLVVGLGLVLVMGLKAHAVLVISDEIGVGVGVGGTSGIGDIVQQRNARLLNEIVKSLDAKAATRQPGDLIKELTDILAQIGGFQVVGNKVIDNAGNVWTLADRTEKDAQGNVVAQGTVLTKTSTATPITDADLEFRGANGVGMTTIAHVTAGYENGLKVYEHREGTMSGVTDDGENIDKEFYSETFYSYNNLGMVNKIDSISADSAGDWQEAHQIVYITSFYENGNAAEQIIHQWNADGTYVRVRRYNIVWENGEMVEWDEETEEEAKG